MEPYPTATTFLPRERIRIDLSSSNYPRFDVNPNTGTAGRERHVTRIRLTTIGSDHRTSPYPEPMVCDREAHVVGVLIHVGFLFSQRHPSNFTGGGFG